MLGKNRIAWQESHWYKLTLDTYNVENVALKMRQPRSPVDQSKTSRSARTTMGTCLGCVPKKPTPGSWCEPSLGTCGWPSARPSSKMLVPPWAIGRCNAGHTLGLRWTHAGPTLKSRDCRGGGRRHRHNDTILSSDLTVLVCMCVVS